MCGAIVIRRLYAEAAIILPRRRTAWCLYEAPVRLSGTKGSAGMSTTHTVRCAHHSPRASSRWACACLSALSRVSAVRSHWQDLLEQIASHTALLATQHGVTFLERVEVLLQAVDVLLHVRDGRS